MNMTLAEFFEIGGYIAIAFIVLLVVSVTVSTLRAYLDRID